MLETLDLAGDRSKQSTRLLVDASTLPLARELFLEEQPTTTWNVQNPNEYGFYSNVNPEVDHPRWSQATERRIGEGGLFAKRRPTLMFNGYADQVAGLYAGMDLRKHF